MKVALQSRNGILKGADPDAALVAADEEVNGSFEEF